MKRQLHSEEFLAGQIVGLSMATIILEFEPRTVGQLAWAFQRMTESLHLVAELQEVRREAMNR